VVAASIADVYYWLGGTPRAGDSGIIYNRRNKANGLGDGGQVLMHMVGASRTGTCVRVVDICSNPCVGAALHAR
jgi:hypothetical protein